MAVNFGYFVLFFFIVLFASIEFLFVIIPAILGRSKVKRKVQQTEFDIPEDTTGLHLLNISSSYDHGILTIMIHSGMTTITQ